MIQGKLPILAAIQTTSMTTGNNKYHSPWFIFSIAFHFLSCIVLCCFAVQYIIVRLAFRFLAFWIQVQ